MTPPWFDKVSARIESFASLKEGWDSYDAKPIDSSVIDMAVRVLRAVPADAPSPYPFPTLDGRVLLEWHVPPRFLEVRFVSADTIAVYVYSMATLQERELTVIGERESVAAIQAFVAELVRR